MDSNAENSQLEKSECSLIGPPQLSPMISFEEPSTSTNTNPPQIQAQTQTIFESITNSFLSNDILTSLSNLFYDAFFGTGLNYETSTATVVHREKGDVEEFHLIYLHSSSLDTSAVEKFRRLINLIMIFDDVDCCIAYINSLSKQKIVLLVSEEFYDLISARIANISLIYVLAEAACSREETSLPYRICQSIDEAYDMISNDIKLDEFMLQLVYKDDHTTLDETFVFSRLFGEIILNQNENEHAFKELVEFARQEYHDNQYELEQIDEFERTYTKTKCISWLVRSCFLSKMLRRAMLFEEVDILFKLRLFIQDLNSEFEKETPLEKLTSVFLTNRIDQSEIDAIQPNQNLLTFQKFLFASTDEQYITENAKNLVIRIDFPSAVKCLKRLSISTNDPMNILINAGIMTKILTIEKKDLYVFMHLEFVSYADDAHLLTKLETVRNDILTSHQLLELTILMVKVNRQTNAEQFISNLADEDFAIDDTKRQVSLSQSLEFLALVHFKKRNFRRASQLFLLCLKVYHRYLPADSSQLNLVYRDLADCFYSIREYSSAIDYFQQAIHTQFDANIPNLVFTAYCLFKIGIVHFQLTKDSDAIEYLNRAETLLQQSGETCSTELIEVYTNLADHFYIAKKHDDAIKYYRKVIQLQPDDFKELYSMHYTIAAIYLQKHEYQKAMIDYEHAFDYARKFMPEQNYTFVLLHNNIGYTKFEQRQHANALEHYSQGLALAAQFLPDTHCIIGTLLSNTALVYSNLRRFDEAIESMEKSIVQLKKTLSDDDEEVAYKRTLLDGIKRKKILHETVGETVDYF